MSSVEKKEKSSISFEFTRGLGELFARQKFALIASTYQAQRVLLISGGSDGKISVLNRALPRPMGIALSGRELAIGCKNEIWFFSLSNKVSDANGKPLPYDLIFLPRRSHVTGDVLIHQLAHVEGNLIFTNTRFSCLSGIERDHSFSVVWKPPFISQISAEDCCHLNGMAMRDGKVRYVTILAESDKPSGWRGADSRKGLLFDILLNKPTMTDLAMPHSPCWHAGAIWCLESGNGQLIRIDPVLGKKELVAEVPGYARGLEMFGQLAFIGVSKIRDKSLAEGLSPRNTGKEPICGIQVIDISKKQLIGTIEFKGAIEELFDIKVLPGVLKPFMVGFEDQLIDQVFSIAPAQ